MIPLLPAVIGFDTISEEILYWKIKKKMVVTLNAPSGRTENEI